MQLLAIETAFLKLEKEKKYIYRILINSKKKGKKKVIKKKRFVQKFKQSYKCVDIM